MELRWEKQTHNYSSGENLFLGKVCVGSAFYGSVTKGETKPYRYEIRLPGIKTADDKFENISDAKARLERAVATWIKWASL